MMRLTEIPHKEIEWKMHTCCNYNCHYCIDNRSRPIKRPDTVQAEDYAYAIINQLHEPWMIQILGGEPFFDAEFLIRASKVFVNHGHWIKIFTNLSADISIWERFIQETYGRIYKIKSTYHPNQTDLDSFLKKALFVKKSIHESSKFKIFSVVMPNINNITNLKKAKDVFIENGLEFDVMPLINNKTDTYHTYTQEELDLIREHFGSDYGECQVEMKNTGKLCRSGLSYFIINGMDAWSCWDAMMKDDRKQWYGNFIEGTFCFPNKGTICTYDKCMCLS